MSASLKEKIMKSLVLILSLLFFTSGLSQVTPADEIKDSLNPQGLPYFKLRKPAGYTLDKQEFTFSPEQGRIHIKRLQDEKEIDFGNLRRTTDDGLYIMTSTLNEEVSFGRFDSVGNFRTLRYDKEKDSVIEEKYLLRKSENQDPEQK